MRILIFCAADLRIGSGTEIRARLLARGLKHCGAEVAVVTGAVPEEFASLGIVSYPWFDSGMSSSELLLRSARAFQPDILYGITEALADEVLAASRKIDRPCVFDLHGIGIVEILELGRKFGHRRSRLINSIRWLRAIQKSKGVTVANPTLLPVVKTLIKRNALLAPGAVDLAHFTPDGPRVELGPTNRIQVVYAGNFLKWQGCDLLLDAAKQIINANQPYDFTLIGSFGRDEAMLQRWQQLIAGGHLRFLEAVDYVDIPPYLRGADILTIPRPFMLSTYLAFPNKITDYLATGRAIVATNLKPHRYAIKDGETGIICRPSASSIAEGLLRLKDGDVRARLGQNARQTAVQRFDMNRTSKVIYNFLQHQ